MADELSEAEMRDVSGAEFLLGLMSEAEAKAFRERLAEDPDARRDYAFWAERVASITDDINPVEPPASLRRRIMRNLFGDSGDQPKQDGHRIRRAGGFGLIVAALAGLVGIVALLLLLDRVWQPEARTNDFFAEISSEDQSLVVFASFEEGARSIRLERRAGGPREGRSHQLWLIRAGTPPVSLGLLSTSEVFRVRLSAAQAEALIGGRLAISEEPEGGSPTGRPSGAFLATGSVSAF